MEELFTSIQSASLFIGSLTVIGSALMWVYQKTIGKARERREEERNRLLREKIDASNAPLIFTLNKLSKEMESREHHANKLDDIAAINSQLLKNHNERLDKHHERLVILEVKNNVRKVGYIEESERNE